MDNVYKSTLSWCQARDIKHFHQPTLSSTNDWAKSELKKVSEPTLFFAENQSAGRGRGSNSWSSPQPGHGFLATYVFPMDQAPQPIASPQFGLHLFKSLRACWPSLDWSIKAPNDIYLGNSKIAGLLLETVQMGST
ncbi:MAG: biotin synthetase, partial [Pseudomonadota bacterium]